MNASNKEDPVEYETMAAADDAHDLEDAALFLEFDLLDSADEQRLRAEDAIYVQMIHCSMTMEVGFAVNPQDIGALVRTYVRAVECLRLDPRFANGGDMRDFWMEFKNAGRA